MPVEGSFLGRGWGFPPEFDPVSRAARMVSAEQDIRESLTLLLATRPGERVMHPDYGCGLHALVFDIIDERMLTEIREAVDRAILFFEPRIRLDRIDLDTAEIDEGRLRIGIDYTIRSTNSRSNIVYPFYFREGTHVRL